MNQHFGLYKMLEGQVIKDLYHLEKLIGAGGFGGVFRAQEVVRDRVLRQSAVKLILDSSTQHLEELQAATTLDHPHLIRCYAAGECHLLNANFLFLSMEMAEYSLEERLLNGPLPETVIRQLIQHIAAALVYLHAQKQVHRDLKPGNVLWVQDCWKLSDFGLVRHLGHASYAHTSNPIGTIAYMPPEAFADQRRITTAWDVWSLGILLVEVLTDQLPYEFEDQTQLLKRVTHNELRLPPLPREWQPIVAGCLQTNWRQRWTAQQVLDALPSPPPQPPPKPPSVSPSPTPVLPRPATRQPRITRRGFSRLMVLTAGGITGSSLLYRFFGPPASSPPRSAPSAPSSARSPSPAPTATPSPPPPEPEPESVVSRPTFEFEVVTITGIKKSGFLGLGQPKVITQWARRQADYHREDLGEGVTLDVVRIPGGTFTMGSPESEEGRREREGPQHTVTVPEFWVGKYAVTQAQWRAVAALPQAAQKLDPDPSEFKGDQRPVEQVSWHDAMEFCARLSQHTGRPYRLPSEAEWEYACRAGTTTPFHFGPTITTDLANYRGTDSDYQGQTSPGNYGAGPKGEYRAQTTEVGRFPANGFGLYDMHGNVWEWCRDHWHDSYQGAPTDGSAWTTGGDDGSRVLRGGSWGTLPRHCRSASRAYVRPDFRYFHIGFRVVCSAPGRS